MTAVSQKVVKLLAQLLGDESGAVTIEWVTLAAGVLLAGLVALFSVYLNGATPLGNNMSRTMSEINQGMSAGPPPALNGN